MKVMIEMPLIRACSISECTYNHDQGCHARAITIGDGDRPGCDTFFNGGTHCGSNGTAGVGACKVAVCKHNTDFECQASDVTVGMTPNGVCCTTFSGG